MMHEDRVKIRNEYVKMLGKNILEEEINSSKLSDYIFYLENELINQSSSHKLIESKINAVDFMELIFNDVMYNELFENCTISQCKEFAKNLFTKLYKKGYFK